MELDVAYDFYLPKVSIKLKQQTVFWIGVTFCIVNWFVDCFGLIFLVAPWLVLLFSSFSSQVKEKNMLTILKIAK